MQIINSSRVTKVVKAKIKAKVERVILHSIFATFKTESFLNLAEFEIACQEKFHFFVPAAD